MTFSPIPSVPPAKGQPISRSLFLSILNAALSSDVREFRFARQSALLWLAIYPGDLQVSLRYAQALIGEQRLDEARSVLRGLSLADPENPENILRWLSIESGDTNLGSELQNWAAALDGRNVSSSAKASRAWGEGLYAIRQSLKSGNAQAAEQELPCLLGIESESPLLALTHLQTMAASSQAPLPARRSLAEFYHRRWPDCLGISLLLGHWLIEEGSIERGVALLHQTAIRDLSGQVALKNLGANHPYRSLWPENLVYTRELVVPARVSAALGWNRLPSGLGADSLAVSSAAAVAQSTGAPAAIAASGLAAAALHNETQAANDKTPDEDILRFSAELDRLAASLDELPASQYDGRFPVYVIFSVHSRLAVQYGAQGALEIETEMKQLAQTISQNQAVGGRGRWGATVYLPDQPESSTAHGLSPLQTIDPWSLKLSLVDLDRALAKRGEMIAALLIVGGPEIVPYHNLPNPIDDPDNEVPSDNPYATLDENYFIPEWPVGRLPGEDSRDNTLLVNTLRNIRDQRSRSSKKTSGTKHWFGWITKWLKPKQRQFRKGFGYSAAVWRNASFQVYRPVGESRAVLISPPGATNGGSGNGKNGVIPAARLGYFNLHGLADAPEWYGQRDPQEPGDGPDYPVAIRPGDLHSMEEKIPLVVFSEACYGAHVQGKNSDQAMALKFLATGTQVVAGSTTMSYGAMNAPLIAADLLGFCFWKGLLEGLTAGEALQRAKIQLASEMHQRQGYLDGEDQKTLISFVMFGDPLASLPEEIRRAKNRKAHAIRRLVHRPATMNIVCDRATGCSSPEGSGDQSAQAVCKTNNQNLEALETGNPVPGDVMSYVKQIVANYLPGMVDASASYSEEHPECLAHNHTCPTNQLNKQRNKQAETERSRASYRRVVTLNKSMQKGGHTHYQIARLTLDSNGKLVKMVVSR